MKAERQQREPQKAEPIQSKQEKAKLSFVDNRPQASSQTKLIQSIQKKENKTGLPDNLKTGMENLSGFSMDDVRVHYNSSKPAQLNALAYAQGTDIHVAPGQEFQCGIKKQLVQQKTSLGNIIQCFIPTNQEIENWRLLNNDFNHAEIEFATVFAGNVGSIYFPNGRIRLTHIDGPAIEIFNGEIRRFTINDENDLIDYDNWMEMGARTFEERTFEERTNFLNHRFNFIIGGGILFEIFEDGDHLSRGIPQNLNIHWTDAAFNLLYNAANTADNQALVEAINRDPDFVLQQIAIDNFGF